MVSAAFKYVPQPTATTFAFSSVFIFLLCSDLSGAALIDLLLQLLEPGVDAALCLVHKAGHVPEADLRQLHVRPVEDVRVVDAHHAVLAPGRPLDGLPALPTVT